MAETTIEWATHVWNPTTGCDRISAGCDNCYALTLARRLKAMGQAKYANDGDPRTSGPGFGLTVHPDTLNDPLTWAKPRKVFVNSMSDLFHARVPLDFVRRVFEVITATPQHTYQVLTKRASRLPRVADKLDWPANLWMGVSVESADVLHRVDALRRVPAAVRFLSCEPLIGPLGDIDLTGIHWLIAGGESGPHARPMHPWWVRSLRDQAVAAGVAFHFKQFGDWVRRADALDWVDPWTSRRVRWVAPDGSVHEHGEFDGTPKCRGWVQMQRVGKKAAGRELDGRTWDEWPTPALAGAR